MFFRKKKAEPEPKSEPLILQHTHKFKDYHWYIEANYYPERNEYEVNIIEPYVCIHCKERMNKRLVHIYKPGSVKQMEDCINDMFEKYKDYILPKPIVEDQINDDIYVDRTYLKIAETLRGTI